MGAGISTFGAVTALAVSLIMIIKKNNPVYSLLIGAFIGGIAGGAGVEFTVKAMMGGAADMIPAILRIITSGVLAGVLIKSGGALRIAETIIKVLGEKRIIWAMAISVMVLTASGVFIDIAVITAAPIGLELCRKLKYNPMVMILSMIGGGKAGNIISPNPNTIAVAEDFGVPMSSLMAANIIPAVTGLIFTVFISTLLSKRLKSNGERIKQDIVHITKELPSVAASFSGPVVVVFLLALRPLSGISIDPLIALPLGGIAEVLFMGRIKDIHEYVEFGLKKMMPVAVLLIGTGTLAGIIKESTMEITILGFIKSSGIPLILLAPLSGVLMSGATASTTSGATIASGTFGNILVSGGVSPLAGGAMINCGATVLDHLPHGSFFHVTGGSMGIKFKERLRLIPYECIIGISMTVVSIICSYFIK